LVRGDVPQHAAMPGAAEAVAHQDRDHDLVHREHHAGRRAGAPERMAGLRRIGNGAAVAAKLRGDQQAKQPRLAGRFEGLVRKSGVAVDRIGMRRRHPRHRFDAQPQVRCEGGYRRRIENGRVIHRRSQAFRHMDRRCPEPCLSSQLEVRRRGRQATSRCSRENGYQRAD
jgi:hypothetical protein